MNVLTSFGVYIKSSRCQLNCTQTQQNAVGMKTGILYGSSSHCERFEQNFIASIMLLQFVEKLTQASVEFYSVIYVGQQVD